MATLNGDFKITSLGGTVQSSLHKYLVERAMQQRQATLDGIAVEDRMRQQARQDLADRAAQAKAEQDARDAAQKETIRRAELIGPDVDLSPEEAASQQAAGYRVGQRTTLGARVGDPFNPANQQTLDAVPYGAMRRMPTMMEQIAQAERDAKAADTAATRAQTQADRQYTREHTAARDAATDAYRAATLHQRASGGDGIDYAGIADQIEAGLQPPTVNTRSQYGMRVQSELAKRGYNLSQAQTDWAATQRHVSTMNGPQQLRLTQAINALPEMLDSVDALSAQWKGGRFPVLNRVNLAAAKAGAYGPQAAAIANQLDAQIADVVSDLGTVYQGGNSPTDHALALAQHSLSSDWDATVLHDMVGLAKKNVHIRLNSINTTGVAGASSRNPYATPPAQNTNTGGDWTQVGSVRIREKQK